MTRDSDSISELVQGVVYENTTSPPQKTWTWQFTPPSSGTLTASFRYDQGGGQFELTTQTAVTPWPCGGAQADARDTIRAEYTTYSVPNMPQCADFADDGGSAHFSWEELNGGFQEGSRHRPWALNALTLTLAANLEEVRWAYNRGGIRVAGGYRCPHGNASIAGAAANSRHMRGSAGDLYSADHAWTESEFNLLREAGNIFDPVESFSWTQYADHHYHIAW